MGRVPDTQLFHDVFNATPIGIAVENLDGQPLFVNPAFCSMLGFSEEELRNKHCVDFSPPEDAEKDWALFQQLRAGSIDHYQLEKRYFRRDGSLMWGRLSISLLNQTPPLIVAMVDDITEKKTAEESLSDMSRKLIQAHEEERTLIARELHDDINQKVALLTVNLQALKQDSALGEKASRQIEKIYERVADLGTDIQALSHRLHSSKLEYLGLVAAAASFCKEFSTGQNTETTFHSEDIPKQIPAEAALCLFRVLQEALHNAAKHSGVKQFEVSLKGSLHEIDLTVRDSGAGFDAESAMSGHGLGLTSMRERLKLVGGQLSIESTLVGGTTIHARVPLSPHKAKSAGADG
jgi:PAS domain S-box-containing protein